MSGGGYFGNKYFPEGFFPEGFFGTSGEADPNAMSGASAGLATANASLAAVGRLVGSAAGYSTAAARIEPGAGADAFVGGVSERWLKKRKRGGGGKYYRFETQADWDSFLRDIGELRDVAEAPVEAPVVDLVALKAKLAEKERALAKKLSAVRESGAPLALAAERSALVAVKEYVAIAEAAQNEDEEVMLILAMAA